MYPLSLPNALPFSAGKTLVLGLCELVGQPGTQRLFFTRPVDSSRRGGPVAVLVVRSIDLDEGMAEVAYWTVPAARGRNIAARAVRAASTWMFRSVGLHRLELSHSTLNPAWCRIAEKAGYPYEGTRHLPMGYRPTPGDRERTHEMTRMSLTPARHLQSRHQGFYA